MQNADTPFCAVFNLWGLCTNITDRISNLSGQDIQGKRSPARCGTRLLGIHFPHERPTLLSAPGTSTTHTTRNKQSKHSCCAGFVSQSVLEEREGPCTQCLGTAWASRADCSTVYQVPLSCFKLKTAVQVQNLQGSVLTTFKLSLDPARCCSREQANNQAPAAYREACQGFPAAAWGCKCDFGWPCTERKEFAFCIHLLPAPHHSSEEDPLS